VTSGANFTNVLQAAFVKADPKSSKKTENLAVFFAHLGSARAKAACRTLMKLTPKVHKHLLFLSHILKITVAR